MLIQMVNALSLLLSFPQKAACNAT